jgi:hypothetical protein
MTEDIAWLIGAVVGWLVAFAALIAFFAWYFQEVPRLDLFLSLVFTPVGLIVLLVLTIMPLVAALGGAVLGGALARRSMASD